eukprot:1160722-Pelagomonas_calceolata.AAC.16
MGMKFASTFIGALVVKSQLFKLVKGEWVASIKPLTAIIIVARSINRAKLAECKEFVFVALLIPKRLQKAHMITVLQEAFICSRCALFAFTQ